ncbi:Gfo/Idh/MocA family oxidoreductase [Neobacillus mesonae]|uniref:Gfo/Idh/MocA family protein n=1 Tax=Neobacillus mesonae TaxID=1193713 RepID=UPI002E205220|nr:Gfo/Idh/MocA family oxidoreductase [Neobacillus mesonae]
MRVGVIGAGAMGENHVRVYSSMTEHCHLVGVFDTDFSKSGEIAKAYKTKSFPTLEDLLKEVDAVTIAVPTEAHYQIGMKCIAHKVHMLIEKPITSTVAQANKLIKEARNAGIKVQVGHIELYNPAVNVLKNVLSKEDVIAVDIHRLSPYEPRWKKVDVVNDLMIHDIYILHYLFGGEIKKFHSLGYLEDDTIRHAMVLLRLSNGINAQLTASYITEEKVRTIKVVTKEAYIQADLLDKKIVVSRSTNFFMQKLDSNYLQQNIVEKIVVPFYEPLKIQLTDFIHCIKHDLEPNVTGEDGAVSIEVVNKISESILRSEKF